jgi:succinoglycan biosynthesis protein ExoL
MNGLNSNAAVSEPIGHSSARGRVRICYLVHDLGDAAVKRRVQMLQAGGAEVLLVGFHRGKNPIADIETVASIDLGQTHDRAFAQRIFSVFRALVKMGSVVRRLGRVDAIVARNLEMLVLAVRLGTLVRGPVPITYECLDVHPLMVKSGPAGWLLRSVEGKLARRCKLLVTSSPEYISSYFDKISSVRLPHLLVFNKVFDPDFDRIEREAATIDATTNHLRDAGPPWRIGWFGVIRCRKSLQTLCGLATEFAGAVEIIIRGRPAYTEFDNFDEVVAQTPHVRFEGPYRNPQDLARIYQEVHFCWAIDYLYAGQNSQWALANRIYEGGLFKAIPVAVGGTATASWLAHAGVGIILKEPLVQSFGTVLRALDAKGYGELLGKFDAITRSEFVVGRNECERLVQILIKPTQLQADLDASDQITSRE